MPGAPASRARPDGRRSTSRGGIPACGAVRRRRERRAGRDARNPRTGTPARARPGTTTARERAREAALRGVSRRVNRRVNRPRVRYARAPSQSYPSGPGDSPSRPPTAAVTWTASPVRALWPSATTTPSSWRRSARFSTSGAPCTSWTSPPRSRTPSSPSCAHPAAGTRRPRAGAVLRPDRRGPGRHRRRAGPRRHRTDPGGHPCRRPRAGSRRRARSGAARRVPPGAGPERGPEGSPAPDALVRCVRDPRGRTGRPAHRRRDRDGCRPDRCLPGRSSTAGHADVLVLAKAIGGSLPLAVVVHQDDLGDPDRHSRTRGRRLPRQPTRPGRGRRHPRPRPRTPPRRTRRRAGRPDTGPTARPRRGVRVAWAGCAGGPDGRTPPPPPPPELVAPDGPARQPRPDARRTVSPRRPSRFHPAGPAAELAAAVRRECLRQRADRGRHGAARQRRTAAAAAHRHQGADVGRPGPTRRRRTGRGPPPPRRLRPDYPGSAPRDETHPQDTARQENPRCTPTPPRPTPASGVTAARSACAPGTEPSRAAVRAARPAPRGRSPGPPRSLRRRPGARARRT